MLIWHSGVFRFLTPFGLAWDGNSLDGYSRGLKDFAVAGSELKKESNIGTFKDFVIYLTLAIIIFHKAQAKKIFPGNTHKDDAAYAEWEKDNESSIIAMRRIAEEAENN